MDLGKLGNCLAGRVYAIRKDQRLSQDDFGRAIGVSRSAICNYENGTRPVSEQSILAICREFNVNELWMRNGVGEPYKTKGQDAITRLISELKCSNFEGEFLKSYFQMDRTEREQFVQAMYRLITPFAKNLNGKILLLNTMILHLTMNLSMPKLKRIKQQSIIGLSKPSKKKN